MTLLELSKAELLALDKIIADEEFDYRVTLDTDGVYMKGEWMHVLKLRQKYLQVLIQKLEE